MSLWLIIVVLLIGLVLIALEIVALPGGISGICGAVLAVVSIWQGYTHSTLMGNILLISALAVCALLVIIFMKPKTWNKVSLTEELDNKVNTFDESKVQVGSVGVTISRLAPCGTARFGNEVVEVEAVSSFVDQGCEVEVVEENKYKIMVKLIEK